MNTSTTDELATRISRFGLILRHDSCRYKLEQGLGSVKKCLGVYGVSVTFMSTGYVYHEYDLRIGD